MNKIEKLKEINETIKSILIDLETYIFIENIKINDDRIIKNYQSKIIKTK